LLPRAVKRAHPRGIVPGPTFDTRDLAHHLNEAGQTREVTFVENPENQRLDVKKPRLVSVNTAVREIQRKKTADSTLLHLAMRRLLTRPIPTWVISHCFAYFVCLLPVLTETSTGSPVGSKHLPRPTKPDHGKCSILIPPYKVVAVPATTFPTAPPSTVEAQLS
jgi:hypothetical protein